MLNEDYKEMLQLLLSNKVKFLVVGAYALGAYGYPRATGDMDVSFVKNTAKTYSNSLADKDLKVCGTCFESRCSGMHLTLCISISYG